MYLLILLFLLFSLFLTLYVLPNSLIKCIEYLYPSVLFRIKISRKRIALSIDDAPSPNTNYVLDILKRYNVKATFFIIGDYVNKYDPEYKILNRIRDEGHQIGNHTMYNRASIKLSSNELESEIKLLDRIIGKTSLFRPGCGYFNTDMINLVKKLGKKIVLASVYPHDPHIRWSWLNSHFIINKFSQGDIIILHDLKHTNKTLETIIPYILKNGYKITTIGNLTYM